MNKNNKNKIAPNFTLLDYQGKKYKLSDYRGSWVVLYFYPKDNTPGCTMEACAFRDNFKLFKKEKVNVFGISADSQNSHYKFIKKLNLPFVLLSDKNRKVINKYKVSKIKNLFGKKIATISRQTFLIDPAGQILKVYNNFNIKHHPIEIIEDIKSFKKDQQK